MEFAGDKLRTARIYRNMTIKELAEKVDVSKQAISQYERGDIAPKADVLFRLVTQLKFPKSFFLEANEGTAIINNTFFRALFSTKKLDLETQKIKTSFVYEIYNFLDEYLKLPAFDLPSKEFLKDESLEEVAKYLRRYWKLGTDPIKDMVSLLERKGIIVSSFRTDSISIDAFTQSYSTPQGNRYCIVLGDDKNTYVRRNFDAAHELGHIILHDGLSDLTDFDRAEIKEIEREANQFAAAFLLPPESFYIDLKEPNKLDSYKVLKNKWRVSIGAMIMRAKQLGRINATQYQNLYKVISARGWRKKEPYDDIWELQQPQLFKKAIDILLENDVLASGQIVDEIGKHGCHLLPEDVEKLLDLPKGTLSVEYDEIDIENIISLKDRQQRETN